MSGMTALPAGTIHDIVPADLTKALRHNAKALAAWHTITPLARNEWLCWTISVKQQKTRDDHVMRTAKELAEGKRRPCCWMGCIHRTDKEVSPSVRGVLEKKGKK